MWRLLPQNLLIKTWRRIRPRSCLFITEKYIHLFYTQKLSMTTLIATRDSQMTTLTMFRFLLNGGPKVASSWHQAIIIHRAFTDPRFVLIQCVVGLGSHLDIVTGSEYEAHCTLTWQHAGQCRGREAGLRNSYLCFISLKEMRTFETLSKFKLGMVPFSNT